MTCTKTIIFVQILQDGLTGSAWGDWANYTASPLRAEPASAAAAAAAAAKAAAVAKGAAAAKGATATGSAVAGSAGVGSLKEKGVSGKGSPEFDPSTQIGAMAPLGFFDPAGFCKKGDEAGFRNLRAAEIKHGRAAMMAALGAVVQHYVKFPGFESVPRGLAKAELREGLAPGTAHVLSLLAPAGSAREAFVGADGMRLSCAWFLVPGQDDKTRPGAA